MAWWDANYSRRMQVSIPARPSGYAAGDVITVQRETLLLIAAGQMRRDRNDLRVVFDDGASAVEIDRVLTDTATISFRVQSPIAAGVSNSSYWLYHGNPSAAAAPANPRNVWPTYLDGDDLGALTITGTVTAPERPKPAFLRKPTPTLARTPGYFNETNARDADGFMYDPDTDYFYVWYDADDDAKYDGISPWTTHGARSRDLVTWEHLGQTQAQVMGPTNALGPSQDSVSTSLIPHKFTIGGVTKYYGTYLGCEGASSGIPVPPYICHGAVADSITGPWTKTGVLLPLDVDEVYNVDAVIFTFDGGTSYEMFYGSSASTYTTKWATAPHPLGPWTKRGMIHSSSDGLENPRIMHDAARGLWYLFGNQVGDKRNQQTHTIANNMYWSNDRHAFGDISLTSDKTTVNEGVANAWDSYAIGMLSTPVVRDGVAYFIYDAGDQAAFMVPGTSGHKYRHLGMVEAPFPFPFGKGISLSTGATVTTQAPVLVGDGVVKIRANMRAYTAGVGFELRSGSRTFAVRPALGYYWDAVIDGVSYRSDHVGMLGKVKTTEFRRVGSTMTIHTAGLLVWSGDAGTDPLTLRVTENVLVEDVTVIPAATLASLNYLALTSTVTSGSTATLTGTREEGSTVTVNGTTVASGPGTAWSHEATLSPGANEFEISDGTTTLTEMVEGSILGSPIDASIALLSGSAEAFNFSRIALPGPLKIWNGTALVDAPLRLFDGSSLS